MPSAHILGNIPLNVKDPDNEKWIVRFNSAMYLLIFCLLHLSVCLAFFRVGMGVTTSRLFHVGAETGVSQMCFSEPEGVEKWESVDSPSWQPLEMHIDEMSSSVYDGEQKGCP